MGREFSFYSNSQAHMNIWRKGIGRRRREQYYSLFCQVFLVQFSWRKFLLGMPKDDDLRLQRREKERKKGKESQAVKGWNGGGELYFVCAYSRTHIHGFYQVGNGMSFSTTTCMQTHHMWMCMDVTELSLQKNRVIFYVETASFVGFPSKDASDRPSTASENGQ